MYKSQRLSTNQRSFMTDNEPVQSPPPKGIVNQFKHNTSQFFTISNNQDGAEADLVMHMGKNTYQINLGNKKTTFALNDTIFSITEPTSTVYSTDLKCISCDKELEKKNKTFCQFCGHGACKKCLFKMRPFAG